MSDEHPQPGDTIVIHEDFPEENWAAGDELIVYEVDSDGTIWIDLGDDMMGFDPDEYTLVKRDTPTDLSDVDVETFQRNQTNANLSGVFG